jgi:hypothetical protein
MNVFMSMFINRSITVLKAVIRQVKWSLNGVVPPFELASLDLEGLHPLFAPPCLPRSPLPPVVAVQDAVPGVA